MWMFVQEKKADQQTIAAEGEQRRLREQAQQAQAQETLLRRQAQAEELAARQKAYASDMNQVQEALAVDNLGTAKELLNRNRPQVGQQDLRGFEWRYLWQFCTDDRADVFCQRTNTITSLSFSRDGSLLAIGTKADELTVWDIARRQLIFCAEPSSDNPRRVAFSPRSDVLAYSDSTNVVLWDSRTRAEIRRLPVNAQVRDLEFTQEGRLFTASPGVAQGIMLWDVDAGTVMSKFGGSAPGYRFGKVFSVSSDGHSFAQAYAYHNVRIVDTASSSNLWHFEATDETLTGVALSPDGQTLATGSAYSEGIIKLWNVPTHQFIGQLEGSRHWIQWLRFLPDGKTLVSSDGSIRLWDISTRQPLKSLRGYAADAFCFATSSDGRWLATGGWSGQVCLWDTSSSTTRLPAYRTLPGNAISSWAFSPDSQLIGVVQSGSVKIYDARTLQLAAGQALPSTNVNDLTFSPDMRLLVTIDDKGFLGVWDLPDRHMLTNFFTQLAPAYLIGSGFLSAGKHLLTVGGDHVVREWNTVSWQETRRWAIAPDIAPYLAAWNLCPANGLVAVGSADTTGKGVVELLAADDPAKRRRFACHDLAALAFSPDGKTLGVFSLAGVEFRDVETLALKGYLPLLAHSGGISPDGQRAIVGHDGRDAIVIWDMNSHEKVTTLEGKGSIFQNSAFSPDGNMIGSVNLYGVLHLWCAPSWTEIAATEKAGKW
jgi:WD40 repeat protein